MTEKLRNEILSLVKEYADANIRHPRQRIPVTYPYLTSDDVVSIVDAALNFWYTDGKYCRDFRSALSEYVGKEYSRNFILVNSGSSATLIAVRTACEKFDPDNRKPYIITTALAFPTTIAAIYYSGKIPYYIDIDPLTFDIDKNQFLSLIDSDDVCGVVFTHILGFPYEEHYVYDVCKELKKFHISDCCDALGARLSDGTHVGNFSDLATFSFFPAHHITTGEGGAVSTRDTYLYEIANSLVNWGRDCYCKPGANNTCGRRFSIERDRLGKMPDGWDHKYLFSRLGYNLKMTEMQAALGFSQLNKAEYFAVTRFGNYKALKYGIESSNVPIVIPEAKAGIPSPFGFPIYMKYENLTNDLIGFLEENRIGTRRMFAGNITKQPAFMNLPYRRQDLSRTDSIMTRMFWIACHPLLTSEDIDYIVAKIKEFFE